jgi:hypothetical protein
MYVEARDPDGYLMRRFPDPSASGTFDTAGDFDRFFDDSYVGYLYELELPIMQSIDPYADTEMPFEVMPGLLDDIAKALAVAKDGPERRGLMRLRVMAESSASTPRSMLMWLGD